MQNTQAAPLLFKLSNPSCGAVRLPRVRGAARTELLPAEAVTETPLSPPERSEPDLVRHFVTISTRNMSVDGNFYPPGSCTMKYLHKRNAPVGSLREGKASL